MASIGPIVQAEVEKLIHHTLDTYRDDINEAFLLSEAGISVGLSVALTPGTGGVVDFEVGISFVKGLKVRDKFKSSANENQMNLIEVKS